MEPIPLPPTQPLVFFGSPLDVEGLAGTIAVQVFTRDRLAVLIEQDLRPVTHPGRGYACWFEAPRSMMTDIIEHPNWPGTFEARIFGITAQWSIDRHLRPWIYGDQDRGWPSTFEPIRSLAVLGGLLASVRRTQPGRFLDDHYRRARFRLRHRMGRLSPRTP